MRGDGKPQKKSSSIKAVKLTLVPPRHACNGLVAWNRPRYGSGGTRAGPTFSAAPVGECHPGTSAPSPYAV